MAALSSEIIAEYARWKNERVMMIINSTTVWQICRCEKQQQG